MLKFYFREGQDEVQSDNISTEDFPVLTALSGTDSITFYQLHSMNFDV